MGFKHLVLLAPNLLLTAAAQLGGWMDDQINTTICTWTSMRAALIQDTIYMNGGILFWMPGHEDESLGPAIGDDGFDGLTWTYNMSNPIDSDTNVTALLIPNALDRYPGSLGSQFEDGAMLANDNGFLLYGGNIQPDPQGKPPDRDEIIGYQLYHHGADRRWEPHWDEVDLDDKTNRYITYGGAASAPSENKAWYFSGMTSPTHGEIFIDGTANVRAKKVSRALIEVDMEIQSSEKWTNKTLPPTVEGRANPEVIWVPVGDKGILVVLGGVVYPQWVTTAQKSEDPEASEEQSPRFMKEIDIYDIANEKWYKQNTTKGPGARTRGCAVLAVASDQSSFNIYYYGGFDGINAKEAFYDDVWVLSLPSFTWTQLNKGTEPHARAGHKCFTPYGDQMLVVGGYRSMPGDETTCLYPGPFVFFNMSSGDWMDSYHPNEHSEYGVPDKVISVIGGNPAGGAKVVTPPSGWTNEDLEDLFATSSYDMDRITTWGPFQAVESSTAGPTPPKGDDDDHEDGGGGGLPSWVAPVLGVVLGLMVLTGALVVFFLWRKRMIFRNDPNGTSSNASTEDTGKRIIQWIKGQPPGQHPVQQTVVEKAPIATTSEETGTSPEMRSVSALRSDNHASPPPEGPTFYEAAGNPVAELPDTSRAEMSDVHSEESVMKHGYYAEHEMPVSLTDPSHATSTRGAFEASGSVSGSSAAAAAADQAESPVAPDHGPYRLSDSGHVRSLSETLASPFGLTFANDPSSEQGEATRLSLPPRRPSDQVSSPPVSPPTAGDTAGDTQAEDYLAARPDVVSPVLRESDESGEVMEKKGFAHT